MIPGEVIVSNKEITINEGKKTVTISVSNVGDRPVQVGSHFHFFEVNSLLKFDRAAAFGTHLDIASGTSVRFEPGEEKQVDLVEIGGKKIVFGLNGLTNGPVTDERLRECMNHGAFKKFR